MGVTIGKGSTFRGVPLIKVRNLLKAWHRGDRSEIWRIAELKAVDLDPRTAMMLLEELRDRELLGPEEMEDRSPEDGLTESGVALAGAWARKRTPKAAAQRILDRFLDACTAVNARSDLPFEIREVWLFGSMLDRAAEAVGDIDLCFGSSSTEPDRICDPDSLIRIAGFAERGVCEARPLDLQWIAYDRGGGSFCSL